MSQAKARNILRHIMPWALEANSSKTKFRTNHKGFRGRIGIVGGARDYAGAPFFASMSAMRLGADLAYVICSSTASPVIKSYSPDLIVTPLMDCADESEFVAETNCLLSRLHALVIGPGLGREDFMLRRAKDLIQRAKARSIPLILDADSLSIVMEDPSLIRSYPKALLTPNRIELQRMLNSLFAPKQFDLRNSPTEEILELVRKCSSTLDVSILAKGMVDIIYSQESKSQSEHFHLTTEAQLGTNRRVGGQGDITAGLAGVYFHWIEQANSEGNSHQQHLHQQHQLKQKHQMGSEKISHPAAWAGYLAALTTRVCNELAYREFGNGALASNMVDRIHLAIGELLKEGQGQQVSTPPESCLPESAYAGRMNADEIRRYARQMIMSEFGPERQLKLKSSSALIVGAGGLGCPVAIYLAAGGIGQLGIVDDDRVEVSNLHRQILHSLAKVNMLKVDSIKESVLAINPNVKVSTHPVRMTRMNAVDLIKGYDFVIDATDNIVARYMINDACVVAKKPLISGAALKMDGQLTVYNYDEQTPCFRCLFPVPPPASGVGSCSENGVLGVLPGIIGVQQALEAVKLASGIRPATAGKMLLFDGELGLFRHVTLKGRRPDCESCGPKSTLDSSLIDYENFCSGSACKLSQEPPKDLLLPIERVSVEEYSELLAARTPHVLVDVRPKSHSDVSRLAHALQIPVAELVNEPERSLELIRSKLSETGASMVFVVCRRGIASQRGTRILHSLIKSDESLKSKGILVRDVIGGMTAWSKVVDGGFACV